MSRLLSAGIGQSWEVRSLLGQPGPRGASIRTEKIRARILQREAQCPTELWSQPSLNPSPTSHFLRDFPPVTEYLPAVPWGRALPPLVVYQSWPARHLPPAPIHKDKKHPWPTWAPPALALVRADLCPEVLPDPVEWEYKPCFANVMLPKVEISPRFSQGMTPRPPAILW